MRKVYFGPLPAYQFHLLQKFSDQVKHAVFSREGGISKPPHESLNLSFSVSDNFERVKENRARVCGALKLPVERLVSAHQVHKKNIVIVDEDFLKGFEAGSEVEGTDGFITNLPETGLMVKVADCQGILMFDPYKHVVAAVHAGWRGLTQNASGAAITLMQKKFDVDPANLLVGITPSLGPCCAFFSSPEKELPPEFHKFIDDQKRVNLWDFSIEQLIKNGLRKGNIELARVCTMCGAGGANSAGGANFVRGRNTHFARGAGNKHFVPGGKFFSFRRDRGIGGRFGAVISLV